MKSDNNKKTTNNNSKTILKEVEFNFNNNHKNNNLPMLNKEDFSLLKLERCFIYRLKFSTHEKS